MASPCEITNEVREKSGKRPESEIAGKIVSKSRIPPQEQVLANFVIRQKIFGSFLRPAELLTCRLVCKQWDAEASWILQHEKFQSTRRSFRVTFRYSYERQTFLSFNENRSQRTLGEFSEDRKNSPNSKFLQECCTFFAFHGGNVGDDLDAIALFTNPQSNIRGLFLRFQYDFEPGLALANLMHLLMRWGRSLKYLHIKWSPNSWDIRYDRLVLPYPTRGIEQNQEYPPKWGIPLNDPQLESLLLEYTRKVTDYRTSKNVEGRDVAILPALEVLKMTAVFCDISIDLLNWSPNLREYVDNSACSMENILQSNKMDMVTNWFFTFYPNLFTNNVPRLCQLPAENLPRLKKFGWNRMELDKRRGQSPAGSFAVEKLITRILDRGQNSLVKLWNVLNFFRCPGIVLPRLENVRCVTQYRRKGDSILTSVLDLSKLAPNVDHFELNHPPDKRGPNPSQEMAVIDDFDRVLPLTSVSRVTFWFSEDQAHSLTIERVQKIKRLCPNVTSLAFSLSGVPEELPELFRLVWTYFQTIQSLKFHFRHEEECRAGLHSCLDQEETPSFLNNPEWRNRLDSAITGLNVKTCEGLHGLDVVIVEPKKRNEPNILNMKKLEYLEIKIGPFSSLYSLFSTISVHHGFELMKRQQRFAVKVSPQLLTKSNVNK